MLLMQENKRMDAERRHGMTLAEMLMDAEDPDVRKSLIEAMKLERNRDMTPEQLLAELGQDPVNKKLVDKMEELFHHADARVDKNLDRMLDPATEAAKHPYTMSGPFIK